MADPAQVAVKVVDFPGFATNIDPIDAPPGIGFTQINVVSLIMGELTTRGGYREVSFEAG